MKKRILGLSLVVTMLVPSMAFADTYTGTLLPALSGNQYLGWRTKTTNDKYYQHKVSKMGGSYTGVNNWMQSRPGATTPKRLHRVGQPLAIVNFTNNSLVKGVPVRLNLENSTSTTVKVEASGEYYLR